MEPPAATPGKKPDATGTLVRLLLLTGAALAAFCLFLATRPLPPSGASDSRFFPVDAVSIATLPVADRFDFPMGSEHGALTYNAQPFTENRHLGDDLNGIGGENTDLGDPIHAIANGRVIYAGWPADGWGNVVLILHAAEKNGQPDLVQACYAHLDSITVREGDLVKRGQLIGTVGNARGRYLAHLHLELRTFITPFIGAGYRLDTRGWLDPTAFIVAHRGAAPWDLRPEP